ncbi:Hypothetical predicted protein [Paramuricea clavata]|uniref:Endonuclease/exonuclease/phosphatase domain-containing protein n=1 Tax=Paramuricea clavata TaxID=317549 RepID=A0A6S7HB44_PARCT|nr:Hypothetical predicted protein [Paramuricea clavata]
MTTLQQRHQGPHHPLTLPIPIPVRITNRDTITSQRNPIANGLVNPEQLRKVRHTKQIPTTLTSARIHNPANCVQITLATAMESTVACAPENVFVPSVLLSNVMSLAPKTDEIQHCVVHANERLKFESTLPSTKIPNLLICNLRSLTSKVDELDAVVSFNQTDMVCITETWLSPAIPDNLVSLSNFNLFRNDRLVSNGGGVCAYINSNIYCRRIEEFENSSIESLWLSVRPKKLPRSVSVILLAVVYHSTASRQTENVELYSHIQTNVDSFLYSHPKALVLITGDFNFRSTGLDANHLKRIAGLTQIVKVATRADVTLDWCLTNSKVDNIYESIQLPPIGTSDHYTILMKAQPSPSKPDNSHIWKRDLRDSRIRPFGLNYFLMMFGIAKNWPKILITFLLPLHHILTL